MAGKDLLEEKIQNIIAALGGDYDLKPPPGYADKLGWYLELICQLIIAGGGGSGGGGGITAHNLLSNRGMADQHPISAVTGLQAALDAANQALTAHKSSSTDHGDIRTAVNNLQQAVSNINVPSLTPYRTAAAQNAIDNGIKQSIEDVRDIAEAAVKPEDLDDYAKKDDIPDSLEDSDYVHTQSVPASSWHIQHNLNRVIKSFFLVDDSGNEIIGERDTENSTLNLLIINFSESLAGIAYL
jgi:hypothetical protein